MSVQVDRRHSEDSQIWLILLGCISPYAAVHIMGLHSNRDCRPYNGTSFQHTLQMLLCRHNTDNVSTTSVSTLDQARIFS